MNKLRMILMTLAVTLTCSVTAVQAVPYAQNSCGLNVQSLKARLLVVADFEVDHQECDIGVIHDLYLGYLVNDASLPLEYKIKGLVNGFYMRGLTAEAKDAVVAAFTENRLKEHSLAELQKRLKDVNNPSTSSYVPGDLSNALMDIYKQQKQPRRGGRLYYKGRMTSAGINEAFRLHPNVTLVLPQGAVVISTGMIRLTGSARIETSGNPTNPLMKAVFLRDRMYSRKGNPKNLVMFHLSDRASLDGLYIDGNRSNVGFANEAHSIEVTASTDVKLTGLTMVNTSGWTNIHTYSTYDGSSCEKITIEDITTNGAHGKHFRTSNSDPALSATWGDGLSLSCDNIIVKNIRIIDPSDVGIVIFSTSKTDKVSNVDIRNVKIVQLTTSVYGGIGFDPLHNYGDPTMDPAMFNATVDNLSLDSGGFLNHFGIVIGSGPWHAPGNARRIGGNIQITGVKVSGNFHALVVATATTNTFSLTIPAHGHGFVNRPFYILGAEAGTTNEQTCTPAALLSDAETTGGTFGSTSMFSNVAFPFVNGNALGCVGHNDVTDVFVPDFHENP